jgi:hypothetical protein
MDYDVQKKTAVFSDDEGVQPYYDEDIPPDREVVTTPYDAPVRTLLDEIKEKTLIVNPDFQRKSVWDITRKSKLIESLLLNIPIPVLFFAENDDSTKVVIDGQQRLRAIEEFFSGLYRIRNLEMLPTLNGKRWVDLTSKQTRVILSRTIRCVIISCRSDFSLRFEMFERLNTGGMTLADQELRNCVYRGDLNNLLEKLVTNRDFLNFLGLKEPDKRLRHHELILRYFALLACINDYRPPLKRVLNNFMNMHRKMDTSSIADFERQFEEAWRKVQKVFGPIAFRKVAPGKDGKPKIDSAINRAVFDIQMFSLQYAEMDVLLKNAKPIAEAFLRLCLDDGDFSDAISHSTADRKRFYIRLVKWGNKLVELGIDVPYLQDIPEEFL